MSKFIRTKEGIIDTTKIATGSKYMDFATNDESFKEIFKTEPLAKADTIDELCDRYVGISNNGPMIIKYEFDEYYDEYSDSYTKKELLAEYDVIYGAIWTDKGLKYIAKMNSKGELELI